MNFQDIYIISHEGKTFPEHIGYENECLKWVADHGSEEVTNLRLAIYLRKFLSNERLLTQVLVNIVSQIREDKDKMVCTDLCLNNMIRGGSHNLGGKNLMQNLCTAILATNKPVIQFYESNRQAHSWQIKEMTNYSASQTARNLNHRHK